MAKFKMHILAFAVLAPFGAGCANSHGPEASVIEALARHESSILEIVQSGDRTAAARLPGDAVTSATVALDLYDERGEALVDWGLQIELRDVRNLPDGTVEVEYIAGISRRELWDGETTDSFAEEFRHAVLRDGAVVDVTTLAPGDERFEQMRLLTPMLPRETIRRMPGDPYADPVSAMESTAGRAVLSISSPSSLRTYALNWCGRGRYNPYYPNYEWDSVRTIGGDCTNFVSQCLFAGGLTFRTRDCSGLSGSLLTTCRDRNRNWASYWWYNTPASALDHSISWSTPDGLRNHMSERFPSQVHWVWEQAHVGDVAFIDSNRDGRWDHACVVTTAQRRSDGTFDLRVSCHTGSRCDEDFYAMMRNGPYYNNAWIQIQHVL